MGIGPVMAGCCYPVKERLWIMKGLFFFVYDSELHIVGVLVWKCRGDKLSSKS